MFFLLFCCKSNVVCGCLNSFFGVREVILGGGVCYKRVGIFWFKGNFLYILNCLNWIDFCVFVNCLVIFGGILERMI